MEANVLLVDNVSVYREALAAKVSAIGCAVFEAKNLEEARAQLASRTIDVAVVENDLSDESGASLVEEISSRGGATKCVLVVSSSVGAGDLEGYAARVGAAKAIRGPVHPNALMKEVRSILGVRSSTPPVVPEKKAPCSERPTLLVVSDDADLIGRVAAALVARGISVFAVSGRTSMLEEVARQRPHVVVIDAELKESSGFDACRALRGAEVGTGLPVILAVPAASPRHRSACFDAGADDYVEKPFADAELAARVKAHVEMQLLRRRL